MARPRIRVTGSARCSDCLPDFVVPAATRLLDLQARGVLDEVQERFKLARAGYNGIDFFVFLVLFFAQSTLRSIERFEYGIRHFKEALGALAGRKRLPSRSSVSRGLKSMRAQDVEKLGQWLLIAGTDVAQLMRHPACGVLDCQGQRWDFFDWDPTKTALRKRTLPQGEDLPDAKRHSEGFAEPGYGGRKRGELLVSRGTLQHSGSGVWVGAWLAPGNGEPRNWFDQVPTRIIEVCKQTGLDVERAIVRSDGEFGSVPHITACLEAGVHYISRSSRYRLLEQEDIRAQLNEATWYPVGCSRSGPQRYAADLGVVTLTPGDRVLRSSGELYEPVETRIVVSRFAGVSANGCGVGHGDWTYELFCTSLPADGWPASSIVEAYFGRTAQENRFAQEDAAYGLDRVQSFNIAGQHFATLVALMLWNIDIARGFAMDCPPTERQQAPFVAAGVELPPAFPCDDAPSDTARSLFASQGEKLSAEMAQLIEKQRALRAQTGALLATLGIEAWTEKNAGWTTSDDQSALVCPENQLFDRIAVEIRTHLSNAKRAAARFDATQGTCPSCPQLRSCTTSLLPEARRRPYISGDEETGRQLKEVAIQLKEVTKLVEWTRKHSETLVADGTGQGLKRTRKVPPLEVSSLNVHCEDAQYDIAWPEFLPATARRIFRRRLEEIEIELHFEAPPPPPPKPRLVEPSKARRQRRRLTWEERLGRYAAPQQTIVEVTCRRVHPELWQALKFCSEKEKLSENAA